MKYIQLIDQARAHGVATEKKMMEAMEQLSCDLASLEETNPELYWCILRHQHAVFYDRHYSEKMANHDVCHLVYSKKGENGELVGTGAHWTKSQIANATKGMKFRER